jgi:hypothetical protein
MTYCCVIVCTITVFPVHMKYSNYIGVLAALTVIVSCFLTWITIPDLSISITGFDTSGTRFGKPGIINAVISSISLLLFLVPAVWAKRSNIFFAGFNLAWAFRNYILITTCHGGDCPEKQAGLLLLVGGSIVLMLMALFPDLKLKEKK